MENNDIFTGGKGKEKMDLLDKNNGKTIEYVNSKIKSAVTNYRNELKNRDTKNAGERVSSLNQGLEIDGRKFRKPEARFQNSIIHIIYDNNICIGIDNIKFKIKTILANEEKEESINMQEQIEEIMIGVESCLEAVDSLEKDNNWMATNDHFDAEYMIDILAGSKNSEGKLEILNFVQVKSNEGKINIQEITDTHQKYLNGLPKFIGELNKKEVVKVIKNNPEVLDLDKQENQDQLLLLGIAIGDYFRRENLKEEMNANNFYKFFKEKGNYLNPFIVMGILKSPENMKEYKDNNYDYGKLEEILSKTAMDIEYSEEEAIIFHNKCHTNVVLDIAKIYSLIMVKDKIISKIELKHPYKNTKT